MMWIEKGANWLSLSNDFGFLVQAADQLMERMRRKIPLRSTKGE